MNLISLEFLIFLLVGIAIYWLMPEKYRYLVIFVQNIVFISSYNYFSSAILFMIAFVTFIIGKKYRESKNILLIATGIVFVVLMMIICRSGSVNDSGKGILIVGLSFWGLQAISYLLDLYAGKILQEYNFWDYCIYLSLFTNLISGPIERADHIIPQIKSGGGNWRLFVYGCEEVLYGIFLKLVIGERFALIVNYVYDHSLDFVGAAILTAVVSYSFQIYCDFCGYTRIVTGIAKMYGIRLTTNFQQPYLSNNISEFWRRWHVSLSRWLKDYIYIPLGGSYKGVVRKYLNIFLVFSISGFWHGTGMHFLIWGLLHGFYQFIDGITLQYRKKWNKRLRIDETVLTHRCFQIIINFFMVTIAWIFFRAPSIKDALDIIKRMIRGFDISLILGNVHVKQNNWHQGIGRNLIHEESIFELCGLGWFDLVILFIGMAVVFYIDILQYKKYDIHKWFDEQNEVFQWTFLTFSIFFIAVYGLYGGGYHADSFIYANF